MSDTPPPIIVLKDLESIASQFVCARPFRFSLSEFPEQSFEILIKPMTDAQLAKAREFTQLSPPKKRVSKPKEGVPPPPAGQPVEMEEVEEEDFLNPDFIREVNEKSAQRRAYVFQQCLPDIKFSPELEKTIAEIADVFPEPYSAAIEKEIFRRSQSELAIVNLANFSVSAG